MTTNAQLSPYRIARRAVNQGARPANTGYAVEKSVTLPKSNNLLKASKNINISTFNVRTLTPHKQKCELVALAEQYKQSIICIQEHRYYHKDIPIKQHNLGKNCTLVTASAWKKQN